jgi:hypothetical protein
VEESAPCSYFVKILSMLQAGRKEEKMWGKRETERKKGKREKERKERESKKGKTERRKQIKEAK